MPLDSWPVEPSMVAHMESVIGTKMATKNATVKNGTSVFFSVLGNIECPYRQRQEFEV